MLNSADSIGASAQLLKIVFAGRESGFGSAAVRIDVRRLAGTATENLFEDITPLESTDGVELFRSGDLLLGHVQECFVASELAARTESLYRKILTATRGLHLYRIWNYVPEINAHTAGLENYRAFCQGRFIAFEAALGPEFEPQLPAASAVGSHGRHLDALFVAGATAPIHFENPEQVPAYHYPVEHGPRAPSFSRATVVRSEGRTWTFISGTSAIKGHQTIASGSLDAQLECTVHNLRLIARKSGLGDVLAAHRESAGHFQVYLRHAADLPAARTRLERLLFRANDVVNYLQCDICRAALDIEIEATFKG